MKMKGMVIGIFLCVLLGINSQALASAITITNWGFESQSLSNGAFFIPLNTITGWSGTPVFGVFNPTTGYFPSEAPEGSNVAWVNNSITQTVSHNVILGQTYELSVEVGNGLSAAFPGYTVELLAGGNVVGVENSLSPDSGTFLTSTVSWTANDYEGQALGIRLSSAGEQSYFDNVRLNAVPIPAAVWLLGSGLIGIIGFRKKFKK